MHFISLSDCSCFIPYVDNYIPQLLRSSLVNNRTQSIVCDDLKMSEYAIFAETRGEKLDMKTKEKADLLEGLDLSSEQLA